MQIATGAPADTGTPVTLTVGIILGVIGFNVITVFLIILGFVIARRISRKKSKIQNHSQPPIPVESGFDPSGRVSSITAEKSRQEDEPLYEAIEESYSTDAAESSIARKAPLVQATFSSPDKPEILTSGNDAYSSTRISIADDEDGYVITKLQ